MASKESTTYLDTAEEQEGEADLAFQSGIYALAAFLSASSAENAASALLVAWGARPSKRHRNSLALHKFARTSPKTDQKALREIIVSLKRLEPHITKARYPIRVGLELATPGRFYTRGMAHQALMDARGVLEAVKALLK